MNRSCLLLTATLAFLLGCQKTRTIEPVVPAGDRVILLEEFTGKGCVNCPLGSKEIENLLSIYDSNLVVVSIHAGFFANPQFFDLGKYDLRTPEGEEIFAMLAPNIGYPAGVVDRVRFDGRFQHGANEWAAFIADELEKEPQLDFAVETAIDESTGALLVEITGVTREDIDGEVRVSVFIVEDGIVDAQDDIEAGGIVEDYVHNHVLRDMCTAYDGEVVAGDLVRGEQVFTQLTTAIQPGWNIERLSVIAAFSINSGGNIRILQAGKADVVQ